MMVTTFIKLLLWVNKEEVDTKKKKQKNKSFSDGSDG